MKFERQNADFDYNRLVVISDLSPQRDVDTQLALLAGNPTSETAIALAASIEAAMAPALQEDPTDAGTYLITAPGRFAEDPADAGTYLIGVA